MSLGTSAIAAGSTMVFSRSMDTWPSVSERMSRIVASVTKPSVTSTLPSGALKRFCSVSAMFSWSWLMIPLWSSVCPRGTCESGADWTVPMSALQLRKAARDGLRIELRGLVACGIEGARVVLGGELRLLQVIQAHREVEGEVGARGIEAVGLEELDLRFRPSRLERQQVAEREVQRRAAGTHRDVGAQLRLRAVAAREFRDGGKARARGRVARIDLERPAVAARREHAVARARLDGGETEQRIDVGGVGIERGGIAAVRGGQIARHQLAISA